MVSRVVGRFTRWSVTRSRRNRGSVQSPTLATWQVKNQLSSINSTMATTKSNTEFCDLIPERHGDAGFKWANIGETIVSKVTSWMADSVFCQVMCCCFDAEVHQEMQLSRRQHDMVQEKLCVSLDYQGEESSITAVMQQLLDMPEPYNMFADTIPVPSPPPAVELVVPKCVCKSTLKAKRSKGKTTPAPAGVCDSCALAEVLKQIPPPDPLPAPPRPVRSQRAVRIVPRFAAAVIAEMRCRLGQLNVGVPGTRLIVEREATRLMRNYNVRSVDAAAHLPLIVREYFLADVHYRVATHEARMTRFQRWMAGAREAPATSLPVI